MTREEAEKKIRDLLVDVTRVVSEYGAPSGYLHASVYSNPDYGETGAYVSFNNESWEGGDDYVARMIIDYSEFNIDLGEQK